MGTKSKTNDVIGVVEIMKNCLENGPFDDMDDEDVHVDSSNDEKSARQMQGDELGGVALNSTSVKDAWNNPKVEVEETKSGAIITVQLPNVRSMEVDIDEDKIVFLSMLNQKVQILNWLKKKVQIMDH